MNYSMGMARIAQIVRPRRLSVSDLGLGVAFIALVVALSLMTPTFMTSVNVLNVGRQISIIAIVAAGQTFVILAGGIDLSMGSIVGLTGVVVAGVTITYGVAAGLLAGVLVACLVGLANGIVITYIRVPDFIATLAMLNIARGLCLIYTGAVPITVNDPTILYLGTGYVGPIPVPIVIMILVFAVSWLVLRTTRFGRYVYAVGGNRRAAAYAGIDVRKVRISVYVIAGLLSALAAVVLTGRIASGDPQAGSGYELQAIAAVVLGGTAIAGGQGSVVRTLLGAMTLGVLGNGMNLLNVSAFYQQFVQGVVIVLAVALSNPEWLRSRLRAE